MKVLSAALMLGLSGTAAFAHSAIEAVIPARGSTLAVAPETIDITFRAPIRLTRVTMTAEDGAETELDLSAVDGFARNAVVPVDCTEGTYRIAWRGLSMDGHAMDGQFEFRVE